MLHEATHRRCWICREQPGDRPATCGAGAAPPLFEASICKQCAGSLTAPHDSAWRTLSIYLHRHWAEIRGLARFDLSKPFPDDARALLAGREHPDISLFVTDARMPGVSMHLINSEVRVLCNQAGEVHSALWTYLEHPIAIKINYLKPGAPLQPPPGTPWHPTRQRKIVMLSPYAGDAGPTAGPQGLRI